MDHILQRKKKTIPFHVIDECVNMKQKIDEQLNSSSNTNRIQNYILKKCSTSTDLFYLQINFDFIKENKTKKIQIDKVFRFNLNNKPETIPLKQKSTSYTLSKDQLVYDYSKEKIEAIIVKGFISEKIYGYSDEELDSITIHENDLNDRKEHTKYKKQIETIIGTKSWVGKYLVFAQQKSLDTVKKEMEEKMNEIVNKKIKVYHHDFEEYMKVKLPEDEDLKEKYQEFLEQLKTKIRMKDIEEEKYDNNVNLILENLLNDSVDKNITVVTDQYQNRNSCVDGTDDMTTCIKEILNEKNFYKTWIYQLLHEIEENIISAEFRRNAWLVISVIIFLLFAWRGEAIQYITIWNLILDIGDNVQKSFLRTNYIQNTRSIFKFSKKGIIKRVLDKSIISNFSVIDFATQFYSRPRMIIVFFHKNPEDFMELSSIATYNRTTKHYRFDIDKIHEQVNDINVKLNKLYSTEKFEIVKKDNGNTLMIKFSNIFNDNCNMKELFEQNLKLYDDPPENNEQRSWTFTKEELKSGGDIFEFIRVAINNFSQGASTNFFYRNQFHKHVLTIRGDIDLKYPYDVNILPRRQNKQTLQRKKQQYIEQSDEAKWDYAKSI